MAKLSDIVKMLFSSILFLLLVGFSTCKDYNFGPKSFEISTPLSDRILHICQSYLVQKTSSIALSIEVETKQARYYFSDLAEEILKSIDRLKIQLDAFGYHHRNSWDFFNIILVDSANSYRKIDPGEKTKNQDYSEYYLIVLKPLKADDYLREVEEIFAYSWKFYIINVSIVVEDSSGLLRLFTYFPFMKDRCFSTAAVELHGRLKFAETFPPKLTNFYNCKIVGTFWDVPPFINLKKGVNSLENIDGFEGHLIKEMAKHMNFTMLSIMSPNDEQRGVIHDNGTATGAIKQLQEKIADFSLGCFRCTLERSTVLSPSQSYYMTNQVYTVKALTEPWTPFQIITYPFDVYIWTLMLIIMIVAILLAFSLEKYRPSALYFIFGYHHSGNVMNMISAWLGSPVVPEPKRNFARFLLALWLFVAFILRNAYQGLLFDLLRSNLGKLPPETSQELADQHYTLVLNIATRNALSGVPIIRSGNLNVVVQNITDSGGFPLVEATNEKIATASPKDFLSYYVLSSKKFGVFHVLKENIFTQHMCIYFSKHSFLTTRFDEVLMNLQSFGLIELWASLYIDDSFIEPKESGPSEGVPMTIHQLTGVFQISIYCFVVAAIVFIAEVISPKIIFLRRLFQ